MEQLMLSLLLWIGANSNYPTPQYLPRLEYRSTEEVTAMYFCSRQRPCRIPREEVVLGFYGLSGSASGVLTLSRDLDVVGNFHHRAILVHELVHHAQVTVGMAKNRNCRGLMEVEAYAIENKWREQNRLPLGPTAFAPAPPGCFRGLPGSGTTIWIPGRPLWFRR